MKLRTITLATALALAVFAPATAVFAQTADGRVTAHAPIACLEELMAYGYRPSGTWG